MKNPERVVLVQSKYHNLHI